MKFTDKYVKPRPTAAEVQNELLAAAAHGAEVAESYRREASYADQGHRQEALARYAIGYQNIADDMLRRAKLSSIDTLESSP